MAFRSPLLARWPRMRKPAGKSVECPPKISFPRRLEGASICYDTLWPSIGVESGGGGKIGGSRHDMRRV